MSTQLILKFSTCGFPQPFNSSNDLANFKAHSLSFLGFLNLSSNVFCNNYVSSISG